MSVSVSVPVYFYTMNCEGKRFWKFSPDTYFALGSKFDGGCVITVPDDLDMRYCVGEYRGFPYCKGEKPTLQMEFAIVKIRPYTGETTADNEIVITSG